MCALFCTFKMSQAGEKKVNIEINIQHQRNRLGKSLKRQEKVLPHGDICNPAGQLNSREAALPPRELNKKNDSSKNR